MCLKLLFGNTHKKKNLLMLLISKLHLNRFFGKSPCSFSFSVAEKPCFEFGNRLLPDADESGQLVEGPLI